MCRGVGKYRLLSGSRRLRPYADKRTWLLGWHSTTYYSLWRCPSSRTSQSPSTDSPAAASDNPQSEAHVLVTIVSKGGSALPAPPAKSDFLVRDDQYLIEVHDLRSVKDEPLTFSLLVDTSGSTQNTRHSQIAGAVRLFKALSKQGNRGYLILFRDEVDANDRIVDAGTAEKTLNHGDSRRGPTALLDAVLHAASNQLSQQAASDFCILRRWGEQQPQFP